MTSIRTASQTMSKKNISFLITLLIICSIIGYRIISKKADYSNDVADFDQLIIKVLDNLGVDTSTPLKNNRSTTKTLKAESIFIEKEFAVAYSVFLPEIKDAISQHISFTNLKLKRIKSKKSKTKKILIFDFYRKNLHVYRLILQQKLSLGDIAIVIDDWGYNKTALEKALALKIPLTFAILPGLPYSKTISESAHAKNHEIILHLPLEPHNAAKHPLEKNTILTTMTDEQIIGILEKQITYVPHLKGINNHMGSKATEDERTMNLVFEQIRKKNLYFLDSYTSDNSIVQKVANSKNVKILKRDIFLDDKNDPDSILKELTKAKATAAAKGFAIVIGHARELTMDVLKNALKQTQQDGFRFVYLSELF